MKKKHFHVFRPKRGSIIQELSKSNVERKLFPVIESYLSQPQVKEEDKKAYQAYKEDLLAFLGQKGEAFPVCYLKPEKNLELLYLAPAIFTKEVSNHNLGELAGAYAPCEEDICPACDLFGFIRGENENSRNSKVRFADAYVANEMGAEKYYLCNKITLQALGEPKLGNVDFYLERPQTSRFWTYNYYYVNDNIVLKPGQLRGRKFYWHHQKVELSKKIEPDRLNKTVRPVKENVSFKGKMYFEGISNRQLNQLIWILNSGSEGLGLKLGGAKPFGLGSVACFVDRVLERQVKILDEKILYEIAENTKFETVTYETAGYSGFVKKEFYKIAGLTSVPVNINITYPRMELQKEEEILGEGFQWFVNNHKTKFGKMPTKANDLNIAEALPQILDEDITLSYNRNKTSKSNLGNGHNGMDKPKGTFRDNTRRRGR